MTLNVSQSHPDEDEVIFGLHPVASMLQTHPGQIRTLFCLPAGDGNTARTQIVQQAKSHGIRVVSKDRAALDALCDGRQHQGVVALCHAPFVYTPWNDFVEKIRTASTPPVVMILDSVSDPQNLGALIRSTVVLGGMGIVIPQDRAAQVTGTVVKSSAGMAQWLPIARVPNLVRAMEQLKQAGLWLYSTTLEGDHTQLPWKTDLRGPVGFVLGSEGHGLRDLVHKNCDVHLSIPMASAAPGASLNVATCGALLLYEAQRQRTQGRP